MLILGLETSTPRSSVALGDGETIIASAALGVSQRHGEFLAPAIEFCLAQVGASATDLTGITVGTGPGLFTGLRVGIATAQSLGAALSLPAVPLSGMDALAFQVRHTSKRVVVAVDARRKEVFWASYRVVPGGVQRDADPVVATPDELAAELSSWSESCLVVGDGGTTYADLLADAGADIAGAETAYPSAAHLVELAVPRFRREETVRPHELQPVYLRQVDAKIGWATRGRMRGGSGA